jgi:spore germination protein GerM
VIGRRTGLLACGAVAVALAITVASCGVPLDQKPRTITQPTAVDEDVPPTTSASANAQEVSVYFLRNDRLEELRYPVRDQPTLGAALNYVLSNPAKGSSVRLRTAVPPGTELRNVGVRNGVARIDLSSEINDISGETQKQAFAQLVFTALSFRGVQKVRFLVEGKGVDAPTDNGNLTTVVADDYDPPLNPR